MEQLQTALEDTTNLFGEIDLCRHRRFNRIGSRLGRVLVRIRTSRLLQPQRKRHRHAHKAAGGHKRNPGIYAYEVVVDGRSHNSCKTADTLLSAEHGAAIAAARRLTNK